MEYNLKLTHWGRVTHICVSKLTIIGSDNGLSPDLRQAIIWTNSGILLIGPLGTNFNEISIEILTVSFKEMRLKVSSAKRRPFCLCLNVLIRSGEFNHECSYQVYSQSDEHLYYGNVQKPEVRWIDKQADGQTNGQGKLFDKNTPI